MTLNDGYADSIVQTQLVPTGGTLSTPDRYVKKVYVDGSGDGHICVIFESHEPIIERHPTKTNNESEWQALYSALSNMQSYDWYVVYSDSQLIVRQFNGEYKTTNPRMRKWRQQCRRFINLRGLNVSVEWIPRHENPAGQHLEQFFLNNKEENGEYLHW
jgi:ribonuclease HI